MLDVDRTAPDEPARHTEARLRVSKVTSERVEHARFGQRSIVISREKGESPAACEVLAHCALELRIGSQYAQHRRDCVVILGIVREAEHVAAEHDFSSRMIAHELGHRPSSVLAS